MARPSFLVQHLVFCPSVEYPDPHRPHRDTTLSGVDYVFGVPAGTEFPFEPEEFWLFARFLSTSDRTGDTKPLTVVCCRLDSVADEEVEVWRRELGSIRLSEPYAVRDRSWAFRNIGEQKYRFPGPGQYVFKLGHAITKWPNWRVKKREYISVEVQS